MIVAFTMVVVLAVLVMLGWYLILRKATDR